jgi:hypothetical protein
LPAFRIWSVSRPLSCATRARAYLLVLRKLLDARNEVLIVSKPRSECIRGGELPGWVQKMMGHESLKMILERYYSYIKN